MKRVSVLAFYPQ